MKMPISHKSKRGIQLLVALVVLLQGFKRTDGLVQNSGTKILSSSSSSLLPDRPKNKKRRRDVSKKYKRNGDTNSENPLPNNKPKQIPRLSEIMQNDERKKEEEEEYSNKERKPKKKQVKPWQANFKTSIRTQGRIKKAFNSNHRSRNQKAKAILKALLSTPPTQCNAANVICALSFSAKALGTRRIEPDDELRGMLFQTLDILHEMVDKHLLNTRQLCNACWAIAKHYDRDSNLLPSSPEAIALSSEGAIGTAVTLNMDESQTVEELQQTRVDETVDGIASQITSILREMDFNDKFFPKIGEICMASWAFGKLRHRKTPPGWAIPPQIGRIASNKANEDDMTRAKNIITFERWGSFGGKNDVETDISEPEIITNELFDAIAASLCRSSDGAVDAETTCLEECSWSELANLGWSFASNGSCKSREAETLLVYLAREARRRLMIGESETRHLKTRDLAQLLWALGTLQSDNFRLADDLVYLVEDISNEYLRLDSRRKSFGRTVRPLRRWSCADLVQVALSLAHARIDELPFLRAIYEENSYRLMGGVHDGEGYYGERSSFYPWEVSVLLWAQARLYLTGAQGAEFEDFSLDAPKFLLNALRDRSLQSAGIGPQEQANIVWSLTVLEQHQSAESIELIKRLFHEAAEACQNDLAIQLEHAHQLWQAYFILEEESPEAVKEVPTWFSEYLEDKWTLEKARDKISSARHRSLSQCLQLMGVEHYNEHDEDIDVAIVLKKNAAWTHQTQANDENLENVSVAVEFDGPNHFTREQDKSGNQPPKKPRALGHTVLKYRLLKKQGWTVVRVPYFEFDKIPFWASMERQRYLQRKLKTHANIKFSDADISEYKALKPDRKSRYD